VSADISRIDQWISSTLRNDAELSGLTGGRVYGDMAPQGATMPLILFSYLGGADKVVTLRTRLTNAIYLVRAVAKGSSYDAIERMGDRIDELLIVPQQGVFIRDIQIVSCAREQPHQRKDMEQGVPIVYLGGFYRVRYQPTFI